MTINADADTPTPTQTVRAVPSPHCNCLRSSPSLLQSIYARSLAQNFSPHILPPLRPHSLTGPHKPLSWACFSLDFSDIYQEEFLIKLSVLFCPVFDPYSVAEIANKPKGRGVWVHGPSTALVPLSLSLGTKLRRKSAMRMDRQIPTHSSRSPFNTVITRIHCQWVSLCPFSWTRPFFYPCIRVGHHRPRL